MKKLKKTKPSPEKVKKKNLGNSFESRKEREVVESDGRSESTSLTRDELVELYRRVRDDAERGAELTPYADGCTLPSDLSVPDRGEFRRYSGHKCGLDIARTEI